MNQLIHDGDHRIPEVFAKLGFLGWIIFHNNNLRIWRLFKLNTQWGVLKLSRYYTYSMILRIWVCYRDERSVCVFYVLYIRVCSYSFKSTVVSHVLKRYMRVLKLILYCVCFTLVRVKMLYEVDRVCMMAQMSSYRSRVWL